MGHLGWHGQAGPKDRFLCCISIYFLMQNVLAHAPLFNKNISNLATSFHFLQPLNLMTLKKQPFQYQVHIEQKGTCRYGGVTLVLARQGADYWQRPELTVLHFSHNIAATVCLWWSV